MDGNSAALASNGVDMRNRERADEDAQGAGRPMLVARDHRLVEAAQAAAAAAGVVLDVVREPVAIRAGWRSAPCVMVGVEMAPLVCGIALEPRGGVHLLGPRLDELATWSSPLQAAVLVLPDQSALLTQVLEQGRVGGGDAVVVRLVGGSGGVGVSTLACALAQQAAGRGLAAAVVELDPTGGGLDVLFGAEADAGWRWPDLRAAAGHVDSLVGRLPNVSGVDVVSHAVRAGAPSRRGAPHAEGRGSTAIDLPSTEAVRAVVGSLCRSHRLVVLDAGTSAEPLLDAWPGQRQVLVCGADVRGVVAARRRAASLSLHDVELVVRTGAGRRIAAPAVADSLGLSLLGAIGDDRRVARAAEAGEPVGRGRRGLARQAGLLLDSLDVRDAR